MHKISIKNETENSIRPTYVSIDGQPINRVTSVCFSQSSDTMPTCEIKIRALTDIDVLADIQFRFTPQTIQEAVKVLRHSLIGDLDLYNAFIASIKSALDELSLVACSNDTAKLITDRIIGEK